MSFRNKNLRNWEPSESDAKDVRDTKLNNVTARETADTVKSESKHIEYVTKGGKPSGPFGGRGRH